MDSVRTTNDKYIQVAILAPVPPNCINRDDNGRPKTVIYGGEERQSPSAQFLKRGWRRATQYGKTLLRTQYAAHKVAGQLGLSDDPIAVGNIALLLFTSKDESSGEGEGGSGKPKQAPKKNPSQGAVSPEPNSEKTKGIILIGQTEIALLAEAIERNPDILSFVKTGAIPEKMVDLSKTKAKEVKGSIPLLSGNLSHSAFNLLDHHTAYDRALVGLYGRMSTNSPINEAPDGALQVARCITVSPVKRQFDYFTATDDVRQDSSEDFAEGNGAAMLGNREFVNSSIMLIQFQIDVTLLKDNAKVTDTNVLSDVINDLIATAISTPLPGAANQGSFATNVRPYAAVVRFSDKGTRADLAPAFLKALRLNTDLKEAATTLLNYYEKAASVYGEDTSLDVVFDFERDFADQKPLPETMAKIAQEVRSLVERDLTGQDDLNSLLSI